MKNKTLVIISFAFIFLLTMSIVSANFFDWITGDVQRTTTSGGSVPTTVEDKVSCTSNDECASGICINGKCRSTTKSISEPISKSGTSSTQKRSSRGSECPRGWNILSASEGGNCCRKAENKGRLRLGKSKEKVSTVNTVNCPDGWIVKSASDGGSYCEPSNEASAETCPTSGVTCDPPTCKTYGSSPVGWCCICVEYEQVCYATSACPGGADIETE